MQSFLSNRKFKIKINNFISHYYKIGCSVPQGAVLSPILFSIYIKDIPLEIVKNKHKQYSQNNMYTYKKGNYTSRIDHILISYHLKENFCKSSILNDIENLSDHFPVETVLFLFNNVETSERISNSEPEEKKFHFFPWKNEKFRILYNANLEKNLNNLDQFFWSKQDDYKDLIDTNLTNLTKIMLNTARKTELELSRDETIKPKIYRKNENLKIDNSLQIMVNNLKQLNFIEKVNSQENKIRSLEYRNLKKSLRRQQRLNNFSNEKNKAIDLEKMLKKDKNKFWQSIKNFRRKKEIIENTDLNLDNFAKFYSSLFSHHDRPSSSHQTLIENETNKYFCSLSSATFLEESFKIYEIEAEIDNLKMGKAIGHDYISNELIKHGKCNKLLCLLHIIFNSMITSGQVPDNFNISLVTPIPKKGELKEPADYRPISVSSSFALLYESLILNKIDANLSKEISINQFGYKPSTSCKHAYFIANETINHYRSNKSSIHLVSLDATKAFDKLWRAGLFHKLRGKIDIKYWRAIFGYYKKSKIIVKLKNKKSEEYKTTEGLKQGGKLSAILFNFFIDELLNKCLDQNIGCKLGNFNVSIVAYCDDILLMSPTVNHLNRLLNTCNSYADSWKLEFNQKKSNYIAFEKFYKKNAVKMNNLFIPRVKSFIYLGLPIGDTQFKETFIQDKFKKCEKSFYSLYGLGCKPNALNPRTIAFIYKQYCQSLFKFGFENLFLSKDKLNILNKRQNILIKQAIGISKFSKSKPLMTALNIDSVDCIYNKHKLFFHKQIKKNFLTYQIFLFLNNNKKNLSNDSYIKQIENVNKLLHIENCTLNIKNSLLKISNFFICENTGLIDTIKFILNNNINNDSYHVMIKNLNSYLHYENYI